jgi:molybdopterin-guanine dinucleotide biosynthesis protein A
VLAGGTSRRFGRNKALARLGGVRLIDRVLAKAQAQTARVVISGTIPEIANIETIPDADPGEGPIAGVLSALGWAGPSGYSAIATFPCDAPFFPDDLVARLRAAMSRNGSFACCQGRRHPAFAIWPLAIANRVSQAYAEGERSLRGMQDRINARAVELPAGQGPDGDPFFNINRQSDLATAQRWLDGGKCVLAWEDSFHPVSR